MALSVNSNIQALNAYRNVNKTQSALSNSLEKLSSGLRINRAADDAAGLAISENLKAQIGGIQQASKNAQDGVSLVQTADGALSQTQTILQRLRTLAVASANGSQSDSSRSAINAEATSLKAELTRIAQTSNFNGVNLLDGTLKTAANFQIGYRADDAANGIAGNQISVGLDSTGVAKTIAATSVGAAVLSSTTVATATTGADYIFSSAASSATVASVTGSQAATAVAASYDFTSGAGLTVTLNVNGTAYTLTVVTNATSAGGLAAALNTSAAASLGGANKVVFTAESNGAISYKGGTAGTTGYAASLSITAVAASVGTTAALLGISVGQADRGEDATKGKFKVNLTVDGVTKDVEVSASVNNTAGLAASLQTAADTAFGSGKVTLAASGTTITATTASTGSTAKVKVNSVQVGGADSTAYGLFAGTAKGTDQAAAYSSKAGSFDVYGLKLDGLDLSDQTSAQTAIGNIDAAITQVSTSRANLGALQNRFQYTIDNLDTSAENLSSAQSRILDTDMASEMVSFTRSQILSQAGSAMLSQAKNLPSSLLELLKS